MFNIKLNIHQCSYLKKKKIFAFINNNPLYSVLFDTDLLSGIISNTILLFLSTRKTRSCDVKKKVKKT